MKTFPEWKNLVFFMYSIIAITSLVIPVTQSVKEFQKDASGIGNNDDNIDKNDDVITETASTTEFHHRVKRTSYKNTNFYTYGIVPYVFNRRVSWRQQNIIRETMKLFQDNTCIRFVPRRIDWELASDLYNLGHNGYIEFVEQRNCFGGMGNSGQKTLVSCCGKEKCIHELGHALGMVHEHQNPGGKGYLRINYKNIPQGQKGRYKIATEDELVPGYPFDMSSPMAYPYRDDITVLTPDINVEKKDFYMFKEISDNHRCPQNNCSHFEMNCVNDGYVTMVQDACACRCPEGLNPKTGCATVLSNDRRENRCGAVYEINAANPTVTFDKSSSQNQECSWLITAPEGDTIVLEFHEFNIAKRNRECADEVDIRYSKIGQGGQRFCGNEDPRLIRSYSNRLMLTFLPSRRRSDGSVFNVTAKLVAKDSLCYNTSDKGFTYRGPMNFSRDYTKCLDWSKAAHCPHNPYKFADMSAGLEENYCRNPGDGLRPWCYTFAHTCKRKYCDVCHVDTPHDLDPPRYCRTMKAMYNYCIYGTDNDKFRCAKKCKSEVLPPQPSVSTVTCSKPPSMPDSNQIDKVNQETFTVGEYVTFRCRKFRKYFRTELKKYCLSNGDWSAGTTACLPCHKERGYVLYNESCYRIETELKTANQHQQTCESLGGNLADVRTLEEQKFITDLGFEQGALTLYIGANDLNDEGKFRFRDSSDVTWTPWAPTSRNAPGKDCVASTLINTWYVEACDVRRQAVCKIPMIRHSKRGGQWCGDLRDDCQRLLTKDSEMCNRDYGSFAITQCPKTCDKCFKHPKVKPYKPPNKTQNTTKPKVVYFNVRD